MDTAPPPNFFYALFIFSAAPMILASGHTGSISGVFSSASCSSSVQKQNLRFDPGVGRWGGGGGKKCSLSTRTPVRVSMAATWLLRLRACVCA